MQQTGKDQSPDLNDIPISTDEYPVFPPVRARHILENRAYWFATLRRRTFWGPKGDEADRQLYALNRLYEALLVDYKVGVRNALQDFWTHDDWPVAEIPDPGPFIHYDPESYAVMACAVLLMLESYNEKIENGMPRDTPAILPQEDIEKIRAFTTKDYEQAPAWVAQVDSLEAPLTIPDELGKSAQGPHESGVSPQFLEKNILAFQPHIYFR